MVSVNAGTRGLPIGNRKKAARFTIAGYGGNLEKYASDQALNLAGAILSVETGLTRRVMPVRDDPYYRAMYDAGLGLPKGGVNGLGDYGDDSEIDPSFVDSLPTLNFVNRPVPVAADNSSAGWLSVLNTFVGEVGKGIGNKIGGRAPSPAIIAQPPANKWLVPALIGGGGLALFMMLRKRA